MTPRKSKSKPVDMAPPVVLTDDKALDEFVKKQNPEVFDPAYEGYRLRVAGVPWPEVAKATGYPSPEAAAKAVSRYMQKASAAMSADHQKEMLQLQIDRYETLVAEWWELASKGKSEKAANIVIRALERLDRIMRITESDVNVSQETIVISADPEEYVKQLMAIDAEREARKN